MNTTPTKRLMWVNVGDPVPLNAVFIRTELRKVPDDTPEIRYTVVEMALYEVPDVV